jgi:hypothetical protein
MEIKVGDYVRAPLVPTVEHESHINSIREGVVIELLDSLRDGINKCVLLSWNETEFLCMTEGAISIPIDNIDPVIQEFALELRKIYGAQQ